MSPLPLKKPFDDQEIRTAGVLPSASRVASAFASAVASVLLLLPPESSTATRPTTSRAEIRVALFERPLGRDVPPRRSPLALMRREAGGRQSRGR